MNRPMILIIDFANVAFSGWYTKADDSSLSNVNAVIIFFQRLRLLKDSFNPMYIVMAEDLSRTKTFRRQMYPQYKAQRKPVDPNILYQMDIMKTIISLLGFPRISNELFEADDIAGMISKWGDVNGFDSIIVSSDRDLYQLISDHTYILSPRSNDLIDRAYMDAEYGLTPEQWIDLKILQGDNSDNIPGIRGIGKKTAMDLMLQFGSIENIYNNLDQIKGHTRDCLIAGQGDIDLTRELVTVITDYTQINMSENMLYRYDVNTDEIEHVLTQYNLYSLRNIMYYGLYPQETDVMEVHQYA